MKFVCFAVLGLFLSLQLCHADLFAGFFGKWDAPIPESPEVKQTVVYKRFEKKGLISTTTIDIPGLARGTGVTRYYDNGKIAGDFKRDGKVQVRLTGNWKVSKNSLSATFKAYTDSGVADQFAKTTLVNPHKIRSTARVGGFTSTLIMTRKKAAVSPGWLRTMGLSD